MRAPLRSALKCWSFLTMDIVFASKRSASGHARSNKTGNKKSSETNTHRERRGGVHTSSKHQHILCGCGTSQYYESFVRAFIFTTRRHCRLEPQSARRIRRIRWSTLLYFNTQQTDDHHTWLDPLSTLIVSHPSGGRLPVAIAIGNIFFEK